MTKVQKLNLFAWALAAAVLAVSFIAWGDTYSWRLRSMNAYKLFPLFGLVAFGLMWSHYIVGAVRRYFGAKKADLKQYFDVTSGIVLAAILLHPGLLWWQLWRDGDGLPPASVLNLFPESLKVAVIMGMVGLGIFLSFELRRWFGQKRWWKLVDYASILAMAIIFVHALRLGNSLNGGWFVVLWAWYGVSLGAALVYTFRHDYITQKKTPLSPKKGN